MRKKALSLLTAACLTISLAPAAFASEADVPREPTEVPTVSVDDMVDTAELPSAINAGSGYSGTGTADDPYVVTSAQGLADLAGLFDQYIGERYIEFDAELIDLSDAQIEWKEWTGLFNYFHGSVDGNGCVITGVPDNCYLFYLWHDGVIQDLTFDLGGNAATLVYMNFNVQDSDGTIDRGRTELNNVKVVSTKDGENEPVVLTGNDQANYAPFVFSTSPYFTMDGCTNYADISGNTYASAFYGYYPLPLDGYPEDADVQITNCANHGNISLRYAGLIFGNPSGMGEDRNVTITDFTNYGDVYGTETAHYFCSDAGSTSLYDSGYFAEMEQDIAGDNMKQTCTENRCPHVGSTGNLRVGEGLEGLALSLNDDKTFSVVEPANSDAVAYYVVTTYAYVNMIHANTNVWEGTNRVSYSETLSGDSLTTRNIMNLELRDGQRPSGRFTLLDGTQGLYISKSGNNACYWMDNKVQVEPGYVHYINKDMEPGSTAMTVYVSAYNADGALLDTVQYEG